MAPPLPLVAVLLANLPEISPIEALLALYIAPPLPAAVLPSKSAAILLIDLLLYICKRTHGMITCYTWFDYFRTLCVWGKSKLQT